MITVIKIGGNSADKLRHLRTVAYPVELVMLNKHQSWVAELVCTVTKMGLNNCSKCDYKNFAIHTVGDQSMNWFVCELASLLMYSSDICILMNHRQKY